MPRPPSKDPSPAVAQQLAAAREEMAAAVAAMDLAVRHRKEAVRAAQAEKCSLQKIAEHLEVSKGAVAKL